MTSIIHSKQFSLSTSCIGVKLDYLAYRITCTFTNLKPVGSKMSYPDMLMIWYVALNWVILSRSNYSTSVTFINVKQEEGNFESTSANVVRTYVPTHKYQSSNVVRMTGVVRGSLSVRNMSRRVAVPWTHQRQYQHVEDSLTFGKKDVQMRIVLITIEREERHVECRYTICRMRRSDIRRS